MNLFRSVLRRFENLGIRPNQSRLNGKVLMAFTCYWFSNALQCVFLVREVNNFSEITNSIIIISASTTIAIYFTILIVNATKIFVLVNNAEELADRAIEKNPTSKKMYEAALRQIEKWNKLLYFFITKMTPLGLILPKSIASFIIYFTSDLGEDAFVLPTPTWFPFDWKNPIGYLIAVLFEYMITIYMTVFIGSLAVLGIAAFLFEITIIKDMSNNLNSIKKTSKSHGDGTRLQTFEKISNFIEIHSMMKQVMRYFSEVGQPFFMVLFISGLVFICVSMLMIQTELAQREMDLVAFFMAFLFLCYAFGLTLIVCDIAQRACDSFNNIYEVMVQVNWYLLPYEIQRMLPLILNVVQQPAKFECFGSISCSRETFKKILNKAYSCFMMLRHFIK